MNKQLKALKKERDIYRYLAMEHAMDIGNRFFGYGGKMIRVATQELIYSEARELLRGEREMLPLSKKRGAKQ